MTTPRHAAFNLVNVLLAVLVAAVFVPLWCWDALRATATEAWWQLTHGSD